MKKFNRNLTSIGIFYDDVDSEQIETVTILVPSDNLPAIGDQIIIQRGDNNQLALRITQKFYIAKRGGIALGESYKAEIIDIID